MFFNQYTRYLSNRLLNNQSVSDEAEQMMIAKLKVECGHNIVANITNMFNDIALSRTLLEEFKQLPHKGAPEKVNTNIQILRTGCWPESNEEICLIPEELKPCTEAFKLFYNNKHTGRQLSWLMQHGTVEIKSLYVQKSYTFVVSSLQAVILCLFNKYQALTVQRL